MPTLRVPQDYETIQKATDAAKPGDVIVVGAEYSTAEMLAVHIDNLTIDAPVTVENITLDLQSNVTHLTLSGAAPIRVLGSDHGSVIRGNAGDNVLEERSSGPDTIDGGDGNDVIVGDNLDDVLRSTGGADHLSGGNGDDLFKLGAEGSYAGGTIDGGSGTDTLQLSNLDGVTINDVEILDGDLHSGTAAQYRSFTKFINSAFSSPGINMVFDGPGGVVDFTTSVTGPFSVVVRAETATSGVTVTGSGNDDSFIGSDYNDVLNGGRGNDIFTTSGGYDTLNGDTGNDIFVVSAFASGQGIIDGGKGFDTIEASTSLQGFEFRGIELLETFTISGTLQQFNSFRTISTGNQILDEIDLGLSGDGGSIDFRSKIVDGTHVYVSGSDLTSGVRMIGSSQNDSLTGSAYDDRLDGWQGADRLSGGAGNDTFIVDNAGDTVFEKAGEGTDTVVAKVSYALQADQAIERLYADARNGTAAIDLTGNAFAQTLRGTAGANILDGKGGADALYGFAGDDTYVVDDAGDSVFEAAGQGHDTVVALVSYALAAGQEVETLQLARSTGRAKLSLTGNDFGQTLSGNNGANILDGKGGADTLIGKGGNDTYVVDSNADRVIEAAGGGSDTVIATTAYQLTAGQEIETLQLAKSTGTAGYTLVGNAFANTILGNAGANKIGGGLGNDLLKGGKGADTFVFDTAPGPDNVDHIADFTHGEDAIRLAKSLFAGLSPGHLDAGAFKDLGEAGATVDADDRLLYDHTTGALSYDADGSGTAAAAVTVAVLDNHARLDHTDILIV